MIEITDGELSVKFDGGSFSVASWSPAVANRVNGRYEDVRETIRFNINGNVAANNRLLQQVADRANQFAQGERTTPMTIRWTLPGSSTIFVALIVGAFSFSLPPNFSQSPVQAFLDGAVMSFNRRGQWLVPDTTQYIANAGFEDWTGDPLQPDDWTVV